MDEEELDYEYSESDNDCDSVIDKPVSIIDASLKCNSASQFSIPPVQVVPVSSAVKFDQKYCSANNRLDCPKVKSVVGAYPSSQRSLSVVNLPTSNVLFTDVKKVIPISKSALQNQFTGDSLPQKTDAVCPLQSSQCQLNSPKLPPSTKENQTILLPENALSIDQRTTESSCQNMKSTTEITQIRQCMKATINKVVTGNSDNNQTCKSCTNDEKLTLKELSNSDPKPTSKDVNVPASSVSFKKPLNSKIPFSEQDIVENRKDSYSKCNKPATSCSAATKSEATLLTTTSYICFPGTPSMQNLPSDSLFRKKLRRKKSNESVVPKPESKSFLKSSKNDIPKTSCSTTSTGSNPTSTSKTSSLIRPTKPREVPITTKSEVIHCDKIRQGSSVPKNNPSLRSIYSSRLKSQRSDASVIPISLNSHNKSSRSSSESSRKESRNSLKGTKFDKQYSFQSVHSSRSRGVKLSHKYSETIPHNSLPRLLVRGSTVHISNGILTYFSKCPLDMLCPFKGSLKSAKDHLATSKYPQQAKDVHLFSYKTIGDYHSLIPFVNCTEGLMRLPVEEKKFNILIDKSIEPNKNFLKGQESFVFEGQSSVILVIGIKFEHIFPSMHCNSFVDPVILKTESPPTQNGATSKYLFISVHQYVIDVRILAQMLSFQKHIALKKNTEIIQPAFQPLVYLNHKSVTSVKKTCPSDTAKCSKKLTEKSVPEKPKPFFENKEKLFSVATTKNPEERKFSNSSPDDRIKDKSSNSHNTSVKPGPLCFKKSLSCTLKAKEQPNCEKTCTMNSPSPMQSTPKHSVEATCSDTSIIREPTPLELFKIPRKLSPSFKKLNALGNLYEPPAAHSTDHLSYRCVFFLKLLFLACHLIYNKN